MPNVPKLAVPPVSVRTSLDRLDGLLGRRERPLGVGAQHAPGLGQHEPAAGAREQRHAELGLEPPDLLGQARLGHAQRRGGGGERAVLGRREEVA